MRGRLALRLFSAAAAAATIASAFQRPLKASRVDDDDDDDTPLPLVIWHGLGDSAASDGIQGVADLAEEVNPGTFVYRVVLGADENSDRSASWLGNVTTQLEEVCAALAAHPILSTAPAIDAIGFSQGGLFLRGYVERCNFPPVRSLVTYGSPHNGIIDFAKCQENNWLCKGAMLLLKFNTWSDLVQNRLVPAQYYRDPADIESYLKSSNFLADINNEREQKSASYKKNLAKLTNFVMYMFANDTTIIPKETAWFEEVNGTVSTPLRGRAVYVEDWLGLRDLDRKGGLKFKQIPGGHMEITQEDLVQTMKEYFGPLNKFPTGSEVWGEL